MVPAWIVYATVVGALVAAAAVALDRLLGIWALPRRFVWLTGMLVVAGVPFFLATSGPARPTPRVLTTAPSPATRARLAALPRAPRRVPWQIRAYRWSRVLDGRARVIWGVASGVVALAFGVACVSMYRKRSAWREGKLRGHSVLLTNDVGPAVVGFFRPRVVIPEWALELPEGERRLMLDHELEHLSAGDPKLLLVAGVLLVLFPWNAPLWWMARRLRLAIEIDCDARVLRGSDAADEYGLFLIAVGERRTHGLFLAASLAERRSSLERRIHAMTMLRPRHPLLASLPFAAIVVGAAAVAAQTPVPPSVAAPAGAIRAITAPADRINLTNDQVKLIIAAKHPAVAAGTSEDNSVTIVLASNGDYVVSGSTKAATRGVLVATPREPTPGAAPAATGGQVERRVRVAPSETPPQPAFMNFPGIGEIDRTLVKDTYSTSYAAGDVSANAVRVRFVTLTGNRVK
jgi:beta-lactamase regulating signal transducer with metallopeptidase domain